MRESRPSKDNRWRKGQPSLTFGASFSQIAASQNRRRACTAALFPPQDPALTTAASCPPKDPAWMTAALSGGFLPAGLNARTSLLAFLLFFAQFALISSLWTKMPFKHLFYLKILIYTIKHIECLEVDYKNKVKGALNVNI